VSVYDKALDMLGHQEHDICLLDYRLGAHNGIEILLEAAARGIHIPIIFLTGQGEYEVDIQAMKAGAADYLIKEKLNSDLLERSVRYALERAETARALREARDGLEEKVRQRTADLTTVNKELRKASEKMQLFAYSLTHDLKSPATSLLGLTRRFYDNYAEAIDSKGRTYCQQIINASEQICLFVEKINAFISAKESTLNIEEMNLSELLNEIRVEFSNRLFNRKITWIEPETLPRIRADRMGMIRIFRNLVENSLRHGGDELTSINIGFEETDQAYILSVEDDGRGLGKGMKENIFLPFKRASAVKIEGCGIGLAIVKEIIERHGGKIWAGHNLNQGAVFYISISKSL
jgi:light-regulated signal transduction histidine kinase (bacteriophytochrome)